MEQDVVQVCQPCFEIAQSFGLLEWIGIAIMSVVTAIGLFTKKNFFSMVSGLWKVTQTIFGALKKDEKKL
jgi:hypothetical protein